MFEKEHCALLVDLSKAFDCIVYDFDHNSLKLINSFLSGRKFRTKLASSYSLYLDLLVGVPQGSMGSILLTHTCSTFFYAIANLTSLITQTTLPFMLGDQVWTLYWASLKKTPLQFLHCFRTTIWKLTAEIHIF